MLIIRNNNRSTYVVECFFIFKIAVFTHESSYCFQRVLIIAILSVRPSVRLSVRLSNEWNSQKRCKLGSPNLYPGRL